MGYSFKTHLEFVAPISCLVERDGENSKKKNHPFNKLAIASWIHSYFDNVVTKFMINNKTDA